MKKNKLSKIILICTFITILCALSVFASTDLTNASYNRVNNAGVGAFISGIVFQNLNCTTNTTQSCVLRNITVIATTWNNTATPLLAFFYNDSSGTVRNNATILGTPSLTINRTAYFNKTGEQINLTNNANYSVMTGTFLLNFNYTDSTTANPPFPQNGTFAKFTNRSFLTPTAETGSGISYTVDNNNWQNIVSVGIELVINGGQANTAPSAPTFVNPTPANNTAASGNVTINMSCAATLNYYLYFQNVTPPTTLVLTNSSLSNYTTNISTDGKYYYMGACYNVTSNLLSLNTSVQQITLDTKSPNITLMPGNTFNTTRTLDYANLIINQSFLDERDLFAYEINVSRNNNQAYWENNLSLSGTLSKNLSETINIAGFANGIYTVTEWLSDTHTAEEIAPYNIITVDSAVAELQTDPKTQINIADKNGGTLTLTKEFDRYTFQINDTPPSKEAPAPSQIKKFIVESNQPVYIPVSNIPGHTIIWNEETHSGNWVDFNCGIKQNNSTLDTSIIINTSISRINNTAVEISIASDKTELSCQSIGGLNIITTNYTWTKGQPVVNSFKLNNNTFTINTTNVMNVNCTSATRAELFVDGSSYGVNASYPEEKLWSFNSSAISSGVHTFYFNCTVDANTSTISAVRTLTVYNLVNSTFTNPTNNSIITAAFINTSWDPVQFNPNISGAVNTSRANLSLYNNTNTFMFEINGTILGNATTQIWNLSARNITTGQYMLKLITFEPQGTSTQENVTFNVSCTEDWSCTAYTNTYGNPLCPDVYMARTCTDNRGCGTNTTIPSVYFCQASSGSATPAGGGSSPTITYSIASPTTNTTNTPTTTNNSNPVQKSSDNNQIILIIALVFLALAIFAFTFALPYLHG